MKCKLITINVPMVSLPAGNELQIIVNLDSGYSGWLTVEHFGARDMLKAATESFGFVAACLASK